jgi:protein SCO1/2
MKRRWLAVALPVSDLVVPAFGLKTRIVAAAAAITLLAGCSPGGASQRLPNFALTNQSGHVIRAEDLRGRSAVISFLFTNCHDTCPVVTARLAQAQADTGRSLSSSVRFVSITVDPTTDTRRSFGVRGRVRADTTN